MNLYVFMEGGFRADLDLSNIEASSLLALFEAGMPGRRSYLTTGAEKAMIDLSKIVAIVYPDAA